MPGKVFLIGAGPGDPELLTLRAVRMLNAADVVVHDRLVSEEVLAMSPKSACLINVGKITGRHSVPQERINEILLEQARAGRVVARLKGGDPLIFGRGSEEAAFLKSHGISVDYAPGITAAQGAAAATGVPLTHRGLATGVQYVTGHRKADEPLDLDWGRLANPESTLVVYMGVANIGEIADGLMAHGMPPETPVLAISNATTARETRMQSVLATVQHDSVDSGLRAPTLFVIGKVVSLYDGDSDAFDATVFAASVDEVRANV